MGVVSAHYNIVTSSIILIMMVVLIISSSDYKFYTIYLVIFGVIFYDNHAK